MRDVLNRAGVGPKAREVVFLGTDRGELDVVFRQQTFKQQLSCGAPARRMRWPIGEEG